MKVLSVTWLDTMAVCLFWHWWEGLSGGVLKLFRDDTIVLPVLEWKVKPGQRGSPTDFFRCDK